ncbi:PP2C family serine/threonine-protein phosphatase [Prosthecobacter sp.]|uniref:PP2C family serine/threonine-protein phosphatase n=1 Tax=Prosthecobacter sp. TaxID=1965333 RepID=UPI0037842939
MHAERFKKQARAVETSSPDALHADVHAFVAYCIHIIAGVAAAPDAPFNVELYKGREWPLVFLKLLEAVRSQPAGTPVSISQLSQALRSNADTVQPADEPKHASPSVGNPPPTRPAVQPSVPVINVALRNATVGKPYQVEPGAIAAAIARQRGDNPELARISHLQLPDDCGLVFDEATGAVTGTPTRASEGALSLDYVPSRSGCSIPFKVSFLINPDPASLWKDLQPPADAPYQKKLVDDREERHGPFRVVAASRRGRSHANKGEFRDDDFAIGYAADTGWLVIVVADGAGSALYSRRGSEIACAVAKDRLTGTLNSARHNQAEALYSLHRDWQHPEVSKALRQTLYEAALDAHHKLRAEVARPSEELGLPALPVLRNYDTTLIMLVLKKTGEGCVAATFAIGDGGAGLLPYAGEGFPITKPEGGDYAGQTYFLTMPETLRNDEASLDHRFQLTITSEFCAALVMTDGITDPKFPSDSAFADPAQWAAFWSELQPALTSSPALLEWMNFFSPGNHDDRTLVAVMPA